MKMTTLEVEIVLMEHFKFNQKDIVCGLTGTIRGLVRFETDMLVLSKSGFAVAVEIKVSKADLKRDLKKPHIQSIDPRLDYNDYSTSKTMYLGSSPKQWFPKIKHFYYAVPEKLEEAALEQIPEVCGLIVVKDSYVHLNVRRPALASVVRKPKRITDYKWTDEERMNLLRLGTMRQYNLKKKLLKL